MEPHEITIARSAEQTTLDEAQSELAQLDALIVTVTGRHAAALGLRDALHTAMVQEQERVAAEIFSDTYNGVFEHIDRRADEKWETAANRFNQASGQADNLAGLLGRMERSRTHWTHVRDGAAAELARLDAEEANLSPIGDTPTTSGRYQPIPLRDRFRPVQVAS